MAVYYSVSVRPPRATTLVEYATGMTRLVEQQANEAWLRFIGGRHRMTFRTAWRQRFRLVKFGNILDFLYNALFGTSNYVSWRE